MSTYPLDSTKLVDWALDMAVHVAKLSKDPSTKVGAVILDPKRRIVSGGYNGFPRGVEDSDERLNNRETKLRMTIHAERNALSFATAPVNGCTLIVTHPCCAQCAAAIIQADIAHVVWRKPSEAMAMRWAEDFSHARKMFEEAGVQIHEY
jgi:dCMP deaminase